MGADRHLASAYLTEENDPELLQWVRSLPKGQQAKAVKAGLLLVQFFRSLPEGDAYFRRGILPEAVKTGLLALPRQAAKAPVLTERVEAPAAPVPTAPPQLAVEARLVAAERNPEDDLDRMLGT